MSERQPPTSDIPLGIPKHHPNPNLNPSATATATPKAGTLPMRFRVVVFPVQSAPGRFGMTVADPSRKLAEDEHAVWIEADIPIFPTTIKGKVTRE